MVTSVGNHAARTLARIPFKLGPAAAIPAAISGSPAVHGAPVQSSLTFMAQAEECEHGHWDENRGCDEERCRGSGAVAIRAAGRAPKRARMIPLHRLG